MALAVLLTSLAAGSEQLTKVLAEFPKGVVERQWISVNDTVMGGVSTGRMRVTDEGTLEFTGTISLENNGGFASIRTKPVNLNLTGFDTVALRVKGDGRMYWVDLRTTSVFPAASYRAKMETTKDEWCEVRIPIKEFEFSAFGKPLRWAGEINAGAVQSVGLTLYDKKAGPFKLEVAWIRGENSAAFEPCPAP
jgi:monofunctional biosynthetic peptidoglycan transglycosylase